MNVITFEQAWNYGGPLMYVLAGFSFLAITIIMYLWYSQRQAICVPEALARIKSAKDPEAEGARIAERLYASVDWLADIAAIAPLIGLLGTVLGIFSAFGGIASGATPEAKTMELSKGLYHAMVTTIFGLVVAIPCLFMHALLRRRAMRRISEIEELC